MKIEIVEWTSDRTCKIRIDFKGYKHNKSRPYYNDLDGSLDTLIANVGLRRIKHWSVEWPSNKYAPVTAYHTYVITD